jgi:hypothetical protein
MITAKEAQQLAGPTVQELCEFFDPYIREAATAKKRSVTVYHGQLENEAYGNTGIWKQFVEAMKGYGFDAELFYYDGQLVDMRITIKW